MDTVAPAVRKHDWLVLLGMPLAAASTLLWLETTDLDRSIASWFFDAAAGGFPLRYNAFLEVVLHQGARYVVVLIACLAIVGFLLSFIIASLKPQRRLLLFLALSLTLAPAAVATLKSVSNKHCPWDLEEFGGFLPYTRLLEPTPGGLKPGHCFPAGHASAGFALMAFYFVGRARRQPLLAWTGLATGLVAGSVLGFGRMLQGAHFLTHTLWAGLVCWAAILILCLAVIGLPQNMRTA